MAQELSSRNVDDGWKSGWYADVEAGVPFGAGSLSSFGHDEIHAGWSAGIGAGYRFSPVLSAEAFLMWGKVSMTARECCAGNGFWLGSDGGFYHASVLGMPGWNYSDIRDGVSFQKYGAGLNVNILGFFSGTRNGRWLLEVSPQLSLLGTASAIRLRSDKEKLMSGSTEWNFGYGASLRAGYRLTERLGIAISSGITAAAGHRIDGMPRHDHRSNLFWENSIRLSWSFGAGNRRVLGSGHETCVGAPLERPSAGDVVSSTVPESSVKSESAEISESSKVSEPAGQPDSSEVAESVKAPESAGKTGNAAGNPASESGAAVPQTDMIPAPAVVHFAFDSWQLDGGQTSGLHEILEYMKNDENARLEISGWCDRFGSGPVNMKVSRLRAESVRDWFVREGIDAGRIDAEGKGVDRVETVSARARKAVVKISDTEK